MIDQNTKIIMSYRELEFHDKQIRAEAIDEYHRELRAYLRKFSVCDVSDIDFDYIEKRLKEQK